MTEPLIALSPTADFLRSAGFFVALAFLLAGVLLMLAGLHALWRARPWRCTVRLLGGGVLALAGLSLGLVGFGIQGYRALTHEALAAVITVRPLAPQRFEALIRWPDGHEEAYVLNGDEIYLDARILKWQPVAHILGLHTLYELDRVAGRYSDIAQERQGERTVYALGRGKPVDLFTLRKRHAALVPLVDAQYGSASFVAVNRPSVLELRVSTTGLLLRERASQPASAVPGRVADTPGRTAQPPAGGTQLRLR